MQAEKKRLSNKKKLIILLGVSLGILVFSVVALLILNADDEPEYYRPPAYEGEFAEADWNEDIMLDEEYLALDRTVYASGFGFERHPMTDGGDLMLGAEAALLYRVVQAIIEGDADTYNSYFSDQHKRMAGEKAAFTPQKLYDIDLTYLNTTQDDEVGILVQFRVAYKILDNNGTFRNDIGGDQIRYEYYYVRLGGAQVYKMVYAEPN